MSKGRHTKPSRSSAESDSQKRRTNANKKKKYTKLISENPTDPHTKIWQKKI